MAGGGDPGMLAVVTEDPPESLVGEGPPAVRALGDHEERRLRSLGPLGEQVGLHQTDHDGVERHPPLLVALPDHAHPAPSDVDVGDPKAEHLSAA
jgi:hypothetical protein